MSKKERQPGFIYIKSETLNQEIAWSEKSGWVFCEDGTRYSPGEIKVLDAGGHGAITLGVHNVKKVFGGEVVKVERDIRGDGKQNRLKAERETISLTIQIPVKKYRKLQEIARLSGQESLTFINGQADFSAVPCNDCPAQSKPERNACNRDCKTNFLTWLFGKEDGNA
jgi:hypothetical protein